MKYVSVRNHTMFLARYACLILCLTLLTMPLWGEEADNDGTPKIELIDLSSGSFMEQLKPTSSQVLLEKSEDPASPGLAVTVTPGNEGYPGFGIEPQGAKPWDLSSFGHVRARIVNLGDKGITVSLRVDNAGDWKKSPWNTESIFLKPGESKWLKVIFGYGYGMKPGYPLKPEAVTRLQVFTGKAKEDIRFRIESIVAGGMPGQTPPVNPANIRVKPDKGYLLGGGVALDPARQVKSQDGVAASLAEGGSGLQLHFPAGAKVAKLAPAEGKWDLREGNQVRIRIRNTGREAASPAFRLESQQGTSDRASVEIAPGATTDIVISFIPAIPWTGIQNLDKTAWDPEKGTGTKFISDAVSSIIMASDAAHGEQSFNIESVVLEAPPVELPAGTGQKPPVEGDWVQTFNEDFDGNAVDLGKWNIYTANYWDKKTGFSKDNVIVKDGVAILRYEKRTLHHNDDPNEKEFPYASGFLDTYGKWVQRYGYFEARMKLPKAPGLWPAMWLMPDRGLAEGPQWKRADTARGAMEFDIMEFLSRWGTYRFNIAFHWDGYDKGHKQTGSTNIYVDHDKDGYITTGLLWLPGKAVVYNNGKIVAQWESPRISNVPSDIMFTHVMGGWDNNGLDDVQLPDDFVIDYVRCWQRADLASDADGVKSTQATPKAPTTPDPVVP